MDNGKMDLTFVVELRKALHYLYDPINLRKSPLARAFKVDKHVDPAMDLRSILVSAIETLKPSTNVPPHAEAWRFYNLLLRRYVEQFSQQEVASEMNLSARHVRREESNALNALANYLWSRYNLEARWAALKPAVAPEESSAPDQGEGKTPTQQQELDYLQASLPTEPVDLGEMIQGLLQTVRPMAEASNTLISFEQPDAVRHLAIQATAVRQALLITLSSAISACAGGKVSLDVAFHEQLASLSLLIKPKSSAARTFFMQEDESLKMARQLLVPSGGSLEISEQEAGPLTLNVVLPLVGQISVLVIDDNADTQLLLQRYLSDGPYQCIGTRDSEQAVDLAARTLPRVIVLDVMLPGIDGWELLGRLREHPKTCTIPVVICTILPQESLAITLGAAAFIRKPVSREAFMSVLGRLVSSLPK